MSPVSDILTSVGSPSGSDLQSSFAMTRGCHPRWPKVTQDDQRGSNRGLQRTERNIRERGLPLAAGWGWFLTHGGAQIQGVPSPP